MGFDYTDTPMLTIPTDDIIDVCNVARVLLSTWPRPPKHSPERSTTPPKPASPTPSSSNSSSQPKSTRPKNDASKAG